MERARHVDRNQGRIRLVGAAGWLLMALLLRDALLHDGTPTATLLFLGPVALLVTYALTRAWVWHNKHMYRVKGPAPLPAATTGPWTHDRLGRELRGRIRPACGGAEVVLATEDRRKTYR